MSEIKGTCQALAENGLFAMPYDNVWVEQEPTVRMEDAEEDVPQVRICCLARSLKFIDDLRLSEDDRRKLTESIEAGDLSPTGILFRTFLKMRGSKNATDVNWYDLLHTGVMTSELLAAGDSVPHPYKLAGTENPAMAEAAQKAMAQENTFGHRSSDDEVVHLAATAMELGSTLVMRLAAALATSWVDKEEREPGSKLVGTFAKDKAGRKKRKYVKRGSMDYTYVSSFASSMERRTAKGDGRKKALPHLRRGHIHRFWTGSRAPGAERKLVAKFVEATWVNKGDGDAPESKRYKVATT